MRGLVLSGGGAFGPYQAGAWEEIRRRGWTPQVMTGISIGAVNGYLFARGASTEEIRAVWRDWPLEMLPSYKKTFSAPWTAYTRLFDAWVVRLGEEFGRRPLQTELCVVALEAPAFRLRVFHNEEITARTLRAACALPGVLAPVRVNGRFTMDCGAARHLPLKEALDAGADELIVVDLLERHPFPPARVLRKGLLRVLDAVHRQRSEPTAAELERVRALQISRPRLLGGLFDSFRWSPEAVDQLLAAGGEDARLLLDSELGFERQATTAAAISVKKPTPVKPAPQ